MANTAPIIEDDIAQEEPLVISSMYCSASTMVHGVSDFVVDVGILLAEGRKPFVACTVDLGDDEQGIYSLTIFPLDDGKEDSLEHQAHIIEALGRELMNKARALYREMEDEQ